MTIRTEMATFDMEKLLMADRLADGQVVVILEERDTPTQGEQRARRRQQRITLTGTSADQAWSQVIEHAATLAGRKVGSEADG